MAALQIEFGGQVYEFDELDLDLDECETIQKFVGRNLGDFANGVAACEVKSLMALWWAMRKRAGQNPGSIASKPPGFRPVQLFAAYSTAVKAEADRLEAEAKAAEEAAEAEADPTRPAGSSPAPAGTTTTPAGDLAATLSPPG